MVVITGITTAIKIAARVIPILYRGGKKIPPAVRYFDRHRKAATIITTVASTAPLIYDLLNIDYDALLQKRIKSPSSQIRKGRGYNKFASRRPFCEPRYNTSCRR